MKLIEGNAALFADGVDFDPRVHLIVRSHPYGQAICRELNDLAWFVCWNLKAKRFVLCRWVVGGPDATGLRRFMEHASWEETGEPPQRVGDFVATLCDRKHWAKLRERINARRHRAEEIEKARHEEAKEVGRSTAAKLQSLGHTSDLGLALMREGYGLGKVAVTTEEKEARREKAEIMARVKGKGKISAVVNGSRA